MEKLKVGISFSGGAARAIAHIGVIKALNEHNIQVHRIMGTSGGAIIGSLFAAGLTVDEMTDCIKEATWKKIYKPTFPIYGMTKLDFLGKLLGKYIRSSKFEDLKIPFAAIATNLSTGYKAILQSGDLYMSVMASSAIPVLFNPVIINDEAYADGGMLDNMPVDLLKSACDFVIGCNVVPMLPALQHELDSVLKIGLRVFHLMAAHNSQINFPLCDVVIEPKEVLNYHLFDFENAKHFVEIGYNTALAQMPEILHKMHNVSEVKE